MQGLFVYILFLEALLSLYVHVAVVYGTDQVLNP